MNFLLRFYLNSKSKYHNSCAISEIFLQSTLILTAFTLNIFSKCVFCFFILNNNKHLFLSLFTDQVRQFIHNKHLIFINLNGIYPADEYIIW
jgi:hypothetical protein